MLVHDDHHEHLGRVGDREIPLPQLDAFKSPRRAQLLLGLLQPRVGRLGAGGETADLEDVGVRRGVIAVDANFRNLLGRLRRRHEGHEGSHKGHKDHEEKTLGVLGVLCGQNLCGLGG
jgi:hypothetical protein